MPVHRTRRAATDQNPMPFPPAADQPDADPAAPPVQTTSQAPSPVRVPATRTGTAWVALGTAVLLSVLLIVFLVQNTRSTEISFLWMTSTTPLALALLIAAVGSVLLTLVLGTARVAQLRRLVRRQRD